MSDSDSENKLTRQDILNLIKNEFVRTCHYCDMNSIIFDPTIDISSEGIKKLSTDIVNNSHYSNSILDSVKEQMVGSVIPILETYCKIYENELINLSYIESDSLIEQYFEICTPEIFDDIIYCLYTCKYGNDNIRMIDDCIADSGDKQKILNLLVQYFGDHIL